MSNKAFQQNLDDKKGPQPGGPYLIQMLFKEPVEMPDKEKMTAIMEKHIGSTECFCYDKKMAGFAALDHVAEFQDGKCPVQLMVMKCDKFKGKGFDAFLMSQMWDCQEDRDRIFRECKYQVVATDMLTAALPALERANLDADFLEALAELYPTCEAFYFQNCGKLFLAEDVRSHQIEGPDRFIRFGVNVRFFNIEGTEDMLIDTVGMSTLFLPDLQYHFHGMDPNWVVNHAYNAASYILEHDNPIEDGETIDGVADSQMCREVQWKCQYEDCLDPAAQRGAGHQHGKLCFGRTLNEWRCAPGRRTSACGGDQADYRSKLDRPASLCCRPASGLWGWTPYKIGHFKNRGGEVCRIQQICGYWNYSGFSMRGPMKTIPPQYLTSLPI